MNRDQALTAATAADKLRAEVLEAKVADDALDIRLDIAENLSCFTGHFPGLPILAGVIQLNWAIAYARELLGQTAAVIHIDRLKFSYPIQPPRQIHLAVNLNREKKTADFRFYCADTPAQQPLVFSQGRLVYE